MSEPLRLRADGDSVWYDDGDLAFMVEDNFGLDLDGAAVAARIAAAVALADAALDVEYEHACDEDFRSYCPCCGASDTHGHTADCVWGKKIAAYRAATEKGGDTE